jgi:peptidoglycan/LPS O-acetylase OafA/YrhL
MARSNDLPALTSLRFFAALWVVFFHLSTRVAGTLPAAARTVIGRGWMGVPFFFILSGFILAHVYGRKLSAPATRAERGRFWWARVARVYPLYLLALAVFYPLFVHI